MSRPILFASLILLPQVACTTITLSDDIDLTLNFSPLRGPSDALHSPYVEGATFTVWARVHKNPDEQASFVDGWSIASSDPEILFVGPSKHDGDGKTLSAECAARSAGSATLRVLNKDGAVVHSRDVVVRVPDRAELLAHGPVIIHRPDSEAVVDRAQILAGGMATFLVRWYAGSERLNGNGVLSLDAPDDWQATAEKSFLFEDRDWLQVTAPASGSSTIALFANGHPLGSLDVAAVAESAIARITIEGEDESRAADKELLAALAEAFDADGRPIYGVVYSWRIDGIDQVGVGDLYRYQYAAGNPRSLTAKTSGLEVSAVIHAGEGYVSSTNKLGCSLGGHGSPMPFAGLAVLLLLGSTRKRVSA